MYLVTVICYITCSMYWARCRLIARQT